MPAPVKTVAWRPFPRPRGVPIPPLPDDAELCSRRFTLLGDGRVRVTHSCGVVTVQACDVWDLDLIEDRADFWHHACLTRTT